MTIAAHVARLMAIVAPPLCVSCGRDAGRAPPLCHACRCAMRPAARAPVGWAAFAYDGPAGAMVRALKFGGRAALAETMAAQLVARAPAGLLNGALVPVPTHAAHRRLRGLDHARLLAVALARRTGLEVVDCLVREGDAQPQVGRGRRARMDGIAGHIALRRGASVPAAAVVIDDVVTTGATLGACMHALRGGGAQEVRALAFAATEGR